MNEYLTLVLPSVVAWLGATALLNKWTLPRRWAILLRYVSRFPHVLPLGQNSAVKNSEDADVVSRLVLSLLILGSSDADGVLERDFHFLEKTIALLFYGTMDPNPSQQFHMTNHAHSDAFVLRMFLFSQTHG